MLARCYVAEIYNSRNSKDLIVLPDIDTHRADIYNSRNSKDLIVEKDAPRGILSSTTVEIQKT